jgi:dolichol-phosphate mannosyltransferase
LAADKRPSVGFIVPALDERGNLERAVAGAREAARSLGLPHRVYVFDDGSTDGTGAVADALAKADSDVVVFHNDRPLGLGRNYFRGVDAAREDYVMMVPGDGEIPREAVAKILELAGRADVVAPYAAEPSGRPFARRVLSRAFVWLVNALTGQRLRYYNGPCLVRAELARRATLRRDGFAYMAALLVSLLRRGATAVEVAVPLAPRKDGRSKAFRWSNVVDVARTLWIMRGLAQD